MQVINLINAVRLSQNGSKCDHTGRFPALLMITRILGWLATTTIWTEIFQKDYTSWYSNRHLEGRDFFVNLNARHSTQTTRFTDVASITDVPSQRFLMARYPQERVNLMSCYSSDLHVDKTYA